MKRRLDVLKRYPISSIVILGVVGVMAVFAPLIAPHDHLIGELRDRHIPPVLFGGDWNHVLGTDSLGRDILSRIIYGSRISVIVGVVTIIIGGGFGTLMGLISGYAGGWIDEIIMRIVDIKFSLPLILIALALSVLLGPSFALLLGLLSFLIWGTFARQVRGQVLTLKELEYVAAAKTFGASPTRILLKHILPGVFYVVLVISSLTVGGVILAEASLSFLGAGIPPPAPAWGSMVAEGRLYISTAWWVSLIPGMMIGLLVVSTVFLGDWLRDALDPRLRQRAN
ncbi:MAG: ABC transporter permease [Arenicellales bacterium]|nr:ABC transporter permease [Arenicellales bacterium]